MVAIEIPTHIRQNLIILGIMGGICSGKSTVSQIFSELGVHCISADEISNRALQEDVVKNKLVQIWGEHLLDNGLIQRKKLAQIVFQDPCALKQLENILHPIVRQRIQDWLCQLGSGYALLDIPLLWESGWHTICNHLIFVDASIHIRQRRAQTQRGWGDDEILNREKFQIHLEQKKAACAHIIPNNNDIMETRKAVMETWRRICLYPQT